MADQIKGKLLLPILLICSVIWISYSNSLNGSWHLDDLNNILDNSNIQIRQLEFFNIPEIIENPLSHSKLDRPVAFLTFALNWYIGEDITTGYHAVNIIIHCLSSIFLFLVLLKVFETPSMKNSSSQEKYYIALLGATLWAVNPIHVQAVTYIVQRMTILAGLFYIWSIYTYLIARLSVSKPRQISFYSLTFIFYIIAVLSKENALILPGVLFAIELIFLQNKKLTELFKPSIKNIILIIFSLSLGLLILYAIVTFVLSKDIFHSILTGYDIRSFSLKERVLTECRIVIFYLSQIFYPLSTRFSIEHDVVLSTGLLTPLSTLSSIISVALLLISALYLLRKVPLLSFAILFYFYNHCVESTVLQLELLFEHRNYIPSMFLFAGIISGSIYFANKFNIKRSIRTIAHAFLVCFLIFSSISSYTRNWDWRTHEALLVDTIKKAPLSARPLYNLALHYEVFGKEEDPQVLFSMYDRASQLHSSTVDYIKTLAYYRMYNIALHDLKDFSLSLEIARKISEVRLSVAGIHKNNKKIFASLYLLGQYESALKEVSNYLKWIETLSPDPTATNEKLDEFKVEYLNYKALTLMTMSQYDEVIEYGKMALKISPTNVNSLNIVGLAKSRLGDTTRAHRFLTRSFKAKSDYKEIFFLMIENSLVEGNSARAQKYTEMLVEKFTLKEINDALDKSRIRSNIPPPYNQALIKSHVIDSIPTYFGNDQN